MEVEFSSRDQILTQLRNVVLETMKDIPVTIFLFGSWARQEEKRSSDIDVALQSPIEIPINNWVELREQIEESTIPYHVDLVDLSKTDSLFIEKVKKEGILWKDYAKDS